MAAYNDNPIAFSVAAPAYNNYDGFYIVYEVKPSYYM